MKKSRLVGTVCACALALLFTDAANAALIFDANVTPNVIFGTGVTNGSFTVDRNNNIELGLRAKLRFDASGQPENIFNSNGDGTYSFNAGVAPTQDYPAAVWSIEWSVNSDLSGDQHRALNALTYKLGVDSDPSAGDLWTISDPVNVTYLDNAIGTNSTENGGGAVAPDASAYATLIASNNVAQNSWKAQWLLSSFDPTVGGRYDFYLAASDSTGQLARTDISVFVAPVPVPSAVWLFGSGLLGLVGVARRKKAV